MKLIIDNNFNSNNILLLTSKIIDGFKFTLTMTSDNVIIVLNEKKDLSLIENLTFIEIINKQISVRPLNILLDQFKNFSKELLFELIDQNKNNKFFIDLIMVEIQKYKNLSFTFETNNELIQTVLNDTNYTCYLVTKEIKNKIIIKEEGPECYFEKITSLPKLYDFFHRHSNTSPMYLIITNKLKNNIVFNSSLLRLLEE